MSRLTEFENTANLFLSILKLIKPAPDLKVWQWAEKYRILSNEETASPGPWDNERTPYLVEIMDRLTDPTVSKIVFLAARQMGKSTVFLNYLGYLISVNPSPVIIIQPTGDLAEKFSKVRVSNMFRDTPCLKGLVPDEKSRDSSNKILYKECTGMFLILTGANSTAGIISMPVPILYFDEIDQYPPNLSGQGDVISIAEKMQTNFPNRKSIYTSTCTIKGHSKIEELFKTSTKSRWSHKCPSCGKWSQYDWERLDFETMKMGCPRCDKYFVRQEWESGGGQWIAENPEADAIGYHINALDHPIVTWEMLVEEFVEASAAEKKGDNSLLITFKNSRLAISWEMKGETVESHVLEGRREVYEAELPDGVCILTMGVDTQDNRLAYEVVGWGLGFESWGIEYGEIYGDPRLWDVWNHIDELLSRAWSYKNGRRIRISRVAVDTGGHMSKQVYTYCMDRSSRGVYPVKGQGGDKVQLTRPSKISREKGLFMVGVDGIKGDIISWLRIGKPGDGYCHFPKASDDIPINGYDTTYFEMLTAEKKVHLQSKRTGFVKYEWQKKTAGARNESFDCRVYARAALNIWSSQEKKLLERIYLTEPWSPKKAVKDGEKKTDHEIKDDPKLGVHSRKKAKKVHRNIRAREEEDKFKL
jgi:phage terminase large subunit GpA-like protein